MQAVAEDFFGCTVIFRVLDEYRRACEAEYLKIFEKIHNIIVKFLFPFSLCYYSILKRLKFGVKSRHNVENNRLLVYYICVIKFLVINVLIFGEFYGTFKAEDKE